MTFDIINRVQKLDKVLNRLQYTSCYCFHYFLNCLMFKMIISNKVIMEWLLIMAMPSMYNISCLSGLLTTLYKNAVPTFTWGSNAICLLSGCWTWNVLVNKYFIANVQVIWSNEPGSTDYWYSVYSLSIGPAIFSRVLFIQ